MQAELRQGRPHRIQAGGSLGGKKIALRGGGGMARKPICPTPPSSSLVAVPGRGFGLALPYLPCPGGGGGVRPQHTWLKIIPTSHCSF